jgi:hypothetical protein
MRHEETIVVELVVDVEEIIIEAGVDSSECNVFKDKY